MASPQLATSPKVANHMGCSKAADTLIRQQQQGLPKTMSLSPNAKEVDAGGRMHFEPVRSKLFLNLWLMSCRTFLFFWLGGGLPRTRVPVEVVAKVLVEVLTEVIEDDDSLSDHQPF